MAQQTVTALFDRYDEAAAAVARLEGIGIPHADVSLVSKEDPERHAGVTARHGDHAEAKESAIGGTGAGATVGTLLGGAAGLLTGLGIMAIPGVGPVVAAGWLVATLTGAGIGAAAGGLIGGLTGAGVGEADAHAYGEGVRRGGTLVTVRTDATRTDEVAAILDEHGSVDLDERAGTWRAEGWQAPAVAETAAAPAQPRDRSRIYPAADTRV